MRFLALAGALALSACTSLPPGGATYDGGGNVLARVAEIAQREASGEPFFAPKFCDSACTMYLGLSTACFPADGVLRFHSARLIVGDLDPALIDAALAMAGVRVSRAGVEDRMNLLIASFYPPGVRARFLAEWSRSTALVEVPVAELVAAGEARACR